VRPSERLTVIAALLLSALTIAVRPEGGALRLAVFLGIAAATALLAKMPRGGKLGFMRDWLPVVAVLTVFMLLEPLIEAVVPWRLDAALATFDARYLSWLVEAWRGALGRPATFTDVTYLAYVSYYFLPITVAAVARWRGPEAFERTAFALLLGFYLTFLGYILLPASGPRLPAEAEARLLGGGTVSDAARGFLHAAESTTLDAFPSGHMTIAVIAGAFGSCLLGRRAAAAVWAWAAAIVFATVYISVHYAVDLLAGLLLAGTVLATCPRPVRSSTGCRHRNSDRMSAMKTVGWMLLAGSVFLASAPTVRAAPDGSRDFVVCIRQTRPKQTTTTNQIRQINESFGTSFDDWGDVGNLSLGAQLFWRVSPYWKLGFQLDCSQGAINGSAHLASSGGSMRQSNRALASNTVRP